MAPSQDPDARHGQGKPSTATADNGDEDASGGNAGEVDFECPVCFECPDSLGNVATINGCSHQFCVDCISRWARIKSVCPLCKKVFETISSDGIEREVDERTNSQVDSGGQINELREQFDAFLEQASESGDP